MSGIKIIKSIDKKSEIPASFLWNGDTEKLIDTMPGQDLFDLVVTSPPYNIGKEYEEKTSIEDYVDWQSRLIKKIHSKLKPNGSMCWQVGNYVSNGSISPLDIELAPIFKALGMQLRNRIIWRFGHGLHNKKRFSGRYEVIMWYTKSEDYTFNLDDVRIPQKYPGKKHFKGGKSGSLSSNPKGKNPEDVWDIPNVKSNHVEKTIHPCQFPVGLVERLILGLSNPNDTVFDPFAGVCSTGVAAALHNRLFIGSELDPTYIQIGKTRVDDALSGKARYRPHDKPLYDHTQSNLSKRPGSWSD